MICSTADRHFLNSPKSRASSPNSSATESSSSPSPNNISLRFPKKTGEQSGDNSPTKLNRSVVPDSESDGTSVSGIFI
ncbi:hypothetical protein AAHC03_024490 [Spirometra sp. Aus1]